jgi:hypothetical protein
VREIEQEGYTEPETAQKKDTKQTAAVDLSKRLKDFRSLNDAASLKGFHLFSLHTFLNHNHFLFANTEMCMLITSLFPKNKIIHDFFPMSFSNYFKFFILD